MQKDFSDDIGHSSVQEKKMSGIDCTLTQQTCAFAAHFLLSADSICAIPCSLLFALQNTEGTCDKEANLMILNTLKKVDTQYSEVSVAFNRGILKERRKIYDSLFFGIFECKAITSHNPLGKSAQYVRSIEFV